jgi:hypothetical protein
MICANCSLAPTPNRKLLLTALVGNGSPPSTLPRSCDYEFVGSSRGVLLFSLIFAAREEGRRSVIKGAVDAARNEVAF